MLWQWPHLWSLLLKTLCLLGELPKDEGEAEEPEPLPRSWPGLTGPEFGLRSGLTHNRGG